MVRSGPKRRYGALATGHAVVMVGSQLTHQDVKPVRTVNEHLVLFLPTFGRQHHPLPLHCIICVVSCHLRRS